MRCLLIILSGPPLSLIKKGKDKVVQGLQHVYVQFLSLKWDTHRI